jgi:hypothetical protein
MLPLGAKLNIGYLSRAFIVNSLLFYKSKIKQGNTYHNPEKDTTCNNESPIGVMEIKFFIRNGSFLYTSVPYPYQNFSKSIYCDKVTHID